jgi:hypothetical protein
MKPFLTLFLRDIILLPVTGCIFPGNRDHSDIQNCPELEPHKADLATVEHKEYPLNPLKVLPESLSKQHASHGY